MIHASMLNPQLSNIAGPVIVLFRDHGRTIRSRHGHVTGPHYVGVKPYASVVDHHTGAVRILALDRLERDTPRTGPPDTRRACPYCTALYR